jgi:2-hydroxy-3-keto-5-methylthiopentenyl-1-phosphate phosphatase
LNLPFYIVSGGVTEVVGTILSKLIDINNYESFFLFSNEMVFNSVKENIISGEDQLV